nr:divergent polysaccharide deacetylase family protein [Pseudomaricurvus alcaniphilus]
MLANPLPATATAVALKEDSGNAVAGKAVSDNAVAGANVAEESVAEESVAGAGVASAAIASPARIERIDPATPIDNSAPVDTNTLADHSTSTDHSARIDKSTSSETTNKIAIIIDDLGYSLQQGMIAARFPAALTLSILPHSPNGVALAELGHQHGKEIMLHAPMSNIQQLPLDPGGLTDDMRRDSFTDTLSDGLDSIPHIVGVNNHMGSYLTQLEKPMQWLMAELARDQLYFIDSRTSPDSIAHQVALQHEVASRKRDIFLDNVRSEAAIEQQFQKLLQLARQRGNAIAIGHPYPETLAFLNRAVPALASEGIELIFVSELLQEFPARPLPASVVRASTEPELP